MGSGSFDVFGDSTSPEDTTITEEDALKIPGNKSNNKKSGVQLESTRIGFDETVRQMLYVLIFILSLMCAILYFSEKKIAHDILDYRAEATASGKELEAAEAKLAEANSEVEDLTAELDVYRRTRKSYVRSYYDSSMTEFAFTVQEGTLKTDKLPMNFSASAYKDDVYTSQLGLDVSHHQGAIDWEKVAKATATGNEGYKFAFIRAAYRGYKNGELSEDERFVKNIHGAYDNGLDVGVYVYSQAINEEEAKEEAELVLTLLEREGFSPETLKYGIAYDPEKVIGEANARTNDLEPEQWHKNAMVFLDTVKKAGYQTSLYSNLEFEAKNFDMKEAEKYNIWYAEYKDFPTTPYFYKFWQFTEAGQVDGINGNVDINIEFVER